MKVERNQKVYKENFEPLTPEEILAVMDFAQTVDTSDPERYQKAKDFLSKFRTDAEVRQTKQNRQRIEHIERMSNLAQPRLPKISIYAPDHNKVAIKAHLQRRIHEVYEELKIIPKLESWHCGLAFLLLAISLVANLYCFSAMIGDILPQGVVSALAILITLAEYIAPTALYAVLGKKGNYLALLSTIVGSCMIILGLLMIFLGRGEILTSSVMSGAGGWIIK